MNIKLKIKLTAVSFFFLKKYIYTYILFLFFFNIYIVYYFLFIVLSCMPRDLIPPSILNQPLFPVFRGLLKFLINITFILLKRKKKSKLFFIISS